MFMGHHFTATWNTLLLRVVFFFSSVDKVSSSISGIFLCLGESFPIFPRAAFVGEADDDDRRDEDDDGDDAGCSDEVDEDDDGELPQDLCPQSALPVLIPAALP